MMKRWQFSFTGFLEILLITCSDQQIFTGSAYAITLRYSKGCSISAYHYNIVANMMLLTCATHLLAITVARHYWEYQFLTLVRIAIVFAVYLVTGILLSTQGSAPVGGFPTKVPAPTDTYSAMLLPAACFQSGASQFSNTVRESFTKGTFFDNHINGWTQYLCMALFYFTALLVSIGGLIRKGMHREASLQKRIVVWTKQKMPLLYRPKRFYDYLFGVYLTAGIALACWTIISSGLYILDLRRWVDGSGWLELSNGRNPENDPSSFGQLVPLLLMALTLFTFLQILSGM